MTRRPDLLNLAAAFARSSAPANAVLRDGFPLLEYDTGGDLARWYEGTPEVSRSTVGGLFLALLARPDFWPAVIVESAPTVWVIALISRTRALGEQHLVLLGHRGSARSDENATVGSPASC